jgi:hypothetical protein
MLDINNMALALVKQDEFAENGVNAYHIKHMQDGTHHYIVECGDIEILDYNRTEEKLEYFDNRYYSDTVSDIQNILIVAFGMDWSTSLQECTRDNDVYPRAYYCDTK